MDASCKYTFSSLCWHTLRYTPRTSFSKTLQCMAPCLYQSFLAAVKQLFLLQQVILSIGFSMPLLATFTIMWGVHMALALFLLAFYLSQKVCSVFYSYIEFYDLILIPSANKAHTHDVDFCQFWQKLFHVSLSYILQSLWPGKITPEVFWCPDGHFWHVIWGIGPYIANYPEQVLLACIIKNWCAW